MCSWYGPGFVGQKTANGERFDPATQLTGAHKTLPFGSHVKVTVGKRSVVVRINDRGSHVAGGILDMSRLAADQLGIRSKGIARCSIALVG